MSARSSRKRTATKHYGREEIVEEVKDQGSEGRKRQRARGAGSSTSSSSTQQAPETISLTAEVEGGEEEQVPRSLNPFLTVRSTRNLEEMKVHDFAVSAKQEQLWERVTDTQKAQIVKAVTRLLLLKGSTNDKILLKHVKDALDEINSSYKTHCQVALREAQKLLKNTFGFNVETVKSVSEKNSKESISAIFVINDIKSPALQEVLSENLQSLSDQLLPGYFAFCHLVFVSIWTSPGRTIDMFQLLRNIRKVDSRFSESIVDGTAGQRHIRCGSGIDDLGGLSFVALVQRMAKEGYIKESKDLTEPGSVGKKQISFGPRFFVEFGLKQLAQSYFIASGVPEDESVIQELDRERKGYVTGNIEKDEEDDNDGGGYEEQKGMDR